MKKRNTAERYYRFSLIIFSVLAVAFIALFYLSMLAFDPSGLEKGDVVALFFIIEAIVWLPYVIYYLFQFIYYRNVSFTCIQRVKLDNTDTSFFRTIGFRVQVNVNGNPTWVSTKHVFSAGIIGVNKLDDYAGQTVEIGYNKSRNEWIVLDSEES